MIAHEGQAAILLVEDNPRDEKLALRAFAKSRIANEIAHLGLYWLVLNRTPAP